MRLIFLFFTAGLAFFFARPSNAKPGDLDSNFGRSTAGYWPDMRCFATQPDGKTLLGFGTTAPVLNNRSTVSLARINPDGTIDESFHVTANFLNIIYVIDLLDDGRILVGGEFSPINGTPVFGLARFHPDGSLDQSFPIATGVGRVYTLLREPNGNIVVGGDFQSREGVPCGGIVRLTSEGNRDPSFHPGSGFNQAVWTMARQPDGHILAGGDFTAFNGTSATRMARLSTNGDLDLNFDIGSGFNSTVCKIDIDSDGRVLASGSFFNVRGVGRGGFARLLANGALDLDFHPETLGSNRSGLKLQPDGKILIGLQNGTLKRLNADGTTDTTFTPVMAGSAGEAAEISISGDVVKYCCGFSTVNGQQRCGLATVTSNGTLTDSFRPTGPNGTVFKVLAKPNGNVVLAGDFDYYDGVRVDGLVEVDGQGVIAQTYTPVYTNFGSVIEVLALDADGKLLTAGGAKIARFNADGSKDTSFNYPGGHYGPRYAIAALPDGKIILAGEPTNVPNDPLLNGITRLFHDGSVDPSFVAPSMSQGVFGVAVLPDGKLLINATPAEGTTRHLARLNTNGSIDPSFVCNLGGSNGTQFIGGFQVQTDGRIVIGMTDDSFEDGIERSFHLLRLNADGTIDTSFTPALASHASTYAFVIQSDGRIVIGGNLKTVNGIARPGIARLEANGDFDSTFDPGLGVQFLQDGTAGIVFGLTIVPDGRLILGGNFTLCDGSPRNQVAALQTSGTSTAPIIAGPGSLARTIDEDTGFELDLSASAPGDHSITWSVSEAGTGHVTLTPVGNTVRVTYVPMADQNGEDTCAIIANGSTGGADSVVLRVHILPINDPPHNIIPPHFQTPLITGQLDILDRGVWTDFVDGATILTYTYRWQQASTPDGANATDIAHATSLTYTPTSEDAGRFIRAMVTVMDNGRGTPMQQSTSLATDWLKVLAPTTYGEWRAAHFGALASDPVTSGDQADPDFDGRNNLLEYSLGSDPLSAEFASDGVVAVESLDVFQSGFFQRYLTLTYHAQPAATDVAITLETSSDLKTWSTDFSGSPAMEEMSRIRNPDGTDTVKARSSFAVDVTPTFVRIRATRQ